MTMNVHGGEFAATRRAARIGVELPVRCKHGLIRSTVMLKDLTPFGARIAGIGQQREGEPVTLMLPGLAHAVTAFVVWSEPATSGLEFASPLDDRAFAALVADYAIGQMSRPGGRAAPVRRFAA